VRQSKERRDERQLLLYSNIFLPRFARNLLPCLFAPLPALRFAHRRLIHPNIVHYRESFLSKNKDSLCICMEYCDGGDLSTKIEKQRSRLLSESFILNYFVQVRLEEERRTAGAKRQQKKHTAYPRIHITNSPPRRFAHRR